MKHPVKPAAGNGQQPKIDFLLHYRVAFVESLCVGSKLLECGQQTMKFPLP